MPTDDNGSEVLRRLVDRADQSRQSARERAARRFEDPDEAAATVDRIVDTAKQILDQHNR